VADPPCPRLQKSERRLGAGGQEFLPHEHQEVKVPRRTHQGTVIYLVITCTGFRERDLRKVTSLFKSHLNNGKISIWLSGESM
jgi:hypothetical protein